ncbi:TetR/AcrR family transcriptional regulator [Streptomyces sp. NPDC052042]|uniref:TetR/AcrR family transcriptional regulator n=1 Tax=Streptomyces sp. NPDC052042 TaxID=3365683 RepID=UPI0037D340C6
MSGRPRGVDDAVILRTAVEVMGREGPSKLTLALVAQEVGLVPGTLVQRFKSKRGLLLALAEHTARDTDALHERVRTECDSPLKALEALAAEVWGAMATPESFAHHLAFLCADLGDPQFRELAVHSQQTQTRTVTALLDHAVHTGELRPDTDTTTLATTVQATAVGAGLMWAIDQQDTLRQRQRTALDTVLTPHRSTPC